MLFSPDPDAPRDHWEQVGDYHTGGLCDVARRGETERAARVKIGGVLASLPVENPMRRDAYRRAYDRVRLRYRCVSS